MILLAKIKLKHAISEKQSNCTQSNLVSNILLPLIRDESTTKRNPPGRSSKQYLILDRDATNGMIRDNLRIELGRSQAVCPRRGR